MKRALTALILLAFLAGLSPAQDGKPALAKVPRGFDDGRKYAVEEAAEEPITPGALVERLFEYADRPALARFIHLHLTAGEKKALDARLKLGGELATRADAPGVLKLLGKHKPSAIAKALGQNLAARGFTLSDVVAWLARRNFNFRAIQQALNGERIDAFRVMAAVRDADAGDALRIGAWEYNLLDAREEKGGHYQGIQLVEAMLSLGFTEEDFAWVLKHADRALARDMREQDRTLVRWGDPVLIWQIFEARMPERTLFNAIVKRHESAARAREVATLRADACLRWFRTGGSGVKAVYRGPWPDNTGAPEPPTEDALKIGKADTVQFTNGLTEPIRKHFEGKGETLTIVVYEDGSARALLDKPGRGPVNFGPDSPFGNTGTTMQAYEGRVSLPGRGALLYLVYADSARAAPPEIELANVQLASEGAFLVADIDDGLNLTPILLKRVSRLVE